MDLNLLSELFLMVLILEKLILIVKAIREL